MFQMHPSAVEPIHCFSKEPVVLKILCAVSAYFQRNPREPLVIHTSDF